MDFEKLLNELAQGNRDAFQRFYDRYGLPVYRYILEKTGDPERTRALWKEVFRSLMHRLRSSEENDLPLLLLTALADVQLASTPGSEHTAPEVQAQQLSSELLDELHEETSGEEKPTSITADNPVSEPHCTAPEAESTDAPEVSPEPEASPEPEVQAPALFDDPAPAFPEEKAEAPLPFATEMEAAILDEKPKRRRIGTALLLIFLILILLFALWGLVAFLMNSGVLPYYDLGYSWFNSTVYNLFPTPFG